MFEKVKEYFNKEDNGGIVENKSESIEEGKTRSNIKKPKGGKSGEKPQPPKGQVVKEGEKPSEPVHDRFSDPPPKDSIHPKFKKFWEDNKDRIAELIGLDGWNPTGYGDVIEGEEYLYGRVGLTEEEFLEHIFYLSKISGMAEIVGEHHLDWLEDQLEKEWDRIEEEKFNSSDEEEK